MAMTVPIDATVRDRAASAPYPASARVYSSARRDSRPPACWLAPSSSAACCESPAADQGRQAVDEGEVVAAERADARRRVAVTEPGERRDRAAEDALRLGQADLRLHRCGRRSRRGPDRRRSRAARPAGCASAAMTTCARRVSSTRRSNCTTGGQRQESEHPHARKQHRGAAERGDPAAPSRAAAVETDGRGVDERVGGAWHGLSLSQMPVGRPHRKKGSDRTSIDRWRESLNPHGSAAARAYP